ncbi:unnamed protein product [Gongylonema pulchrum]|uniref:Conserved domain protein n=1 Tax=Gongylonema pulchrum TaxID=637853 RepID=A0A183EGP2_9BILA|nr:unnamed protein product [Gongylonema pulchrum]
MVLEKRTGPPAGEVQQKKEAANPVYRIQKLPVTTVQPRQRRTGCNRSSRNIAELIDSDAGALFAGALFIGV